jgi:hypothetical protein
MCMIAVVTLGRGAAVRAMDPDFASFVATGEAVAACDHHRASCDNGNAVVPHRDVCHGHKMGIPPADRALVAAALPDDVYTPVPTSFSADARLDRLIRPPSA